MRTYLIEIRDLIKDAISERDKADALASKLRDESNVEAAEQVEFLAGQLRIGLDGILASPEGNAAWAIPTVIDKQ